MAEPRRPSRQVRRAEARRKQPAAKPFGIERLAAPLIAVAGFFAYHNSLRGAFVLDDLGAILENATIRTLWPPWAPLSPPIRSALAGRPLVNLSFAVNYAWGRFDVGSYHLLNLAIHVLAALVLFGVVRRTFAGPALQPRFRGEAPWIATAVALLWVVHPLTSESVDYTIQRTELLMGLFFLLTLYFSIHGFESPQRWGWHVAALGAFALGICSKEVIVVAPAVVFVYDWLFESGSFKVALHRHRRLYAGFAVVLVLYLLLVENNLHRAFSGIGSRAVSPWAYALTQSGVIFHYLRLALWPAPLVGDYDGWPIATSVASVLPSLIAVLALVGLTFWGLVRRRKLAFLGVWFFAILAPTSSFRPILNEIVAERRMYLPLAAVLVLVVLAGRALLRRLEAPRAVGISVVASVATVLALSTMRRNDDYRTTFFFWSDVVAKRPDDARARMWLGDYYFRNGRSADALAQMQEAVRLKPRDGHALYNLGNVLANLGRTEEAIQQFREAVRSDPAHPRAHFNYARALVRQGRTEEAIEQLVVALHLDPNFGAAQRMLAQLGAAR
jgi:tetratricopeptide (TPR) repeat protein